MKHYRIYFNKKSEWPQIWSIDEGDQTSEINVQNIEIYNCKIISVSLSNRDGLDPNKVPFAWFSVRGKLKIENGTAYIVNEAGQKQVGDEQKKPE